MYQLSLGSQTCLLRRHQVPFLVQREDTKIVTSCHFLFQELAQIYHIKAIPTFQMFKQAQKVTVFSRIKRAICCYRSGSLSEPIFELCGTDAKKLEEKIRELM
ncbi:thioredoxin domain-containing protein 8 isoform X2 [Physeter macrocephalus]|uniref:Thioredoxin domain-containing protein 8 isoform X2 n=1 Tax=Physeter macrocephalus TaxID=9755 RepID=A0A9W2WUZ6_PHYMC|nr:thioredoxin domain-containing protein 8 isoform X2 [Physeter catodon]